MFKVNDCNKINKNLTNDELLILGKRWISKEYDRVVYENRNRTVTEEDLLRKAYKRIKIQSVSYTFTEVNSTRNDITYDLI